MGKGAAAFCPILDVHAKGKIEARGKKNPEEGLVLFFFSCFEGGTLEYCIQCMFVGRIFGWFSGSQGYLRKWYYGGGGDRRPVSIVRVHNTPVNAEKESTTLVVLKKKETRAKNL